MIKVIPATPEILERALGMPAPRTVRAIAFEREGEILGCAGLYMDRSQQVLFGEFSDEVRRAPRSLVVAYRRLLKIAGRWRLPLYSHADEDIEASERFLEHMGFKRLKGRIFQWQN